MTFKDEIRQLSNRIADLKPELRTEEATKTAFILPFIKALGYDIFNPSEVEPEMVCDIGMKKGEKIDYAIKREGKPIILIECKHCEESLDGHHGQLYRYYSTSDAKFAILTNGVEYRFYADLDKNNKMDTRPFSVVSLDAITDAQIEELQRFHKSVFDEEKILGVASELKYLNEIKATLAREIESPSKEFASFVIGEVYEGHRRAKIVEQFTPLIKQAFQSLINERIADRLNAALKAEQGNHESDASENIYAAPKVNTTEEEIEAYYIIKAILADTISPDRIHWVDRKDYFVVYIDDKPSNLVCRLFFNYVTLKKIGFGRGTQERRFIIHSLSDIYTYADQIRQAAKECTLP